MKHVTGRIMKMPARRTARAVGTGLLCSALAAAALLLCRRDEPEKPPQEDPARTHVAQVAFERVPFKVRAPGEMTFSRTSGKQFLSAGTTIQSLTGPVILNVVQAVQVQLSPRSELLLVGLETREGRDVLVLGLQGGEVRVNSLGYDRPQILETPVGRVRGVHSHFTAAVTIGEDGAFKLNVQALTKGLVLSNDLGTVPLPLKGRGYADESGPPRVLPLPVLK